MLCLIFLPKLASKINRNKCPFYFFDMPYSSESLDSVELFFSFFSLLFLDLSM